MKYNPHERRFLPEGRENGKDAHIETSDFCFYVCPLIRDCLLLDPYQSLSA